MLFSSHNCPKFYVKLIGLCVVDQQNTYNIFMFDSSECRVSEVSCAVWWRGGKSFILQFFIAENNWTHLWQQQSAQMLSQTKQVISHGCFSNFLRSCAGVIMLAFTAAIQMYYCIVMLRPALILFVWLFFSFIEIIILLKLAANFLLNYNWMIYKHKLELFLLTKSFKVNCQVFKFSLTQPAHTL